MRDSVAYGIGLVKLINEVILGDIKTEKMEMMTAGYGVVNYL